MNITPYTKGGVKTAQGEQAKDILTKGDRIDLASLRKTGFCAYISRVNDGPENNNFGTLIFVHNVSPETLLEEKIVP